MPTITEFLAEVESDATLNAKYRKDPEATMKEYGLSDTDIQLVLDGKSDVTKQQSSSALQMLHTSHDE